MGEHVTSLTDTSSGTAANASGKPIRHNDSILLQFCLQARHSEVQALLASGASANAVAVPVVWDAYGLIPTTPVRAAMQILLRKEVTPKLAARQCLRVLDILHAYGTDFNDPLLAELAIVSDAPQVLDILVARQAPLPDALSSMRLAIAHLAWAVLPELIRHGINVNATDPMGCNAAALLACGQFRFENQAIPKSRSREAWYADQLVRLREAGLDLDMPDMAGATPMMRSIVCGNMMFAKALARAGAKSAAVMPNGISTIHLAAYCSGQDMVRFLVESGACRKDLLRLEAKALQPDVRSLMKTYAHEIELSRPIPKTATG